VLVDGNDLLAVRKATLEAVERARKGGGPTLIEAQTFRMGGHSTSDDPSRYVPKEMFTEWEKKDPVQRFEKFLKKRKLWTEDTRQKIYDAAMEEVDKAANTADATPRPALETIFSDVYADVPAHIRKQGQASFELARRKGDASAGDGAFPL
jgi:pyruvate dehydrogenase E1 component alpha subunit